MAEFYQLNSPAEDKVISRETKILTDVLSVKTTGTFTIATTSTAKRQKIKFFVDVISFLDLSPVTPPKPPHELKYFKIGKYFELEHTEAARMINSIYAEVDGQPFTILYTCGENDGNGNFDATLSITADLDPELSTYTMYLSSVVTEDSFFNSTLAWLNPDNPNNLIDLLEPEPIDGIGSLPGGGNINDTLVNIAPGSADWIDPQLFYNLYPKGTKDNFGTVKVDGVTIESVGGVISAVEGGKVIIQKCVNNGVYTEYQFGDLKCRMGTTAANAPLFSVSLPNNFTCHDFSIHSNIGYTYANSVAANGWSPNPGYTAYPVFESYGITDLVTKKMWIAEFKTMGYAATGTATQYYMLTAKFVGTGT